MENVLLKNSTNVNKLAADTFSFAWLVAPHANVPPKRFRQRYCTTRHLGGCIICRIWDEEKDFCIGTFALGNYSKNAS